MKHHSEVNIIWNTVKKQSKKLTGNLKTKTPQTGPELALLHANIHSQVSTVWNRLRMELSLIRRTDSPSCNKIGKQSYQPWLVNSYVCNCCIISLYCNLDSKGDFVVDEAKSHQEKRCLATYTVERKNNVFKNPAWAKQVRESWSRFKEYCKEKIKLKKISIWIIIFEVTLKRNLKEYMMYPLVNISLKQCA